MSADTRRDERIDHIARTKAKLTDADSVELFTAFLAGDMVEPLAQIIARRVDEVTAVFREQVAAAYEQRAEDLRREMDRHVAAADRRAERNRRRAELDGGRTGLGGAPAVGYFTVQMSDNAPGGRHTVHLGEYVRTGLGNNVCGLNRHGRDDDGQCYGFSCSGGTTDPSAIACPGCLEYLREHPDLVGGLNARVFSRYALDQHQAADL